LRGLRKKAGTDDQVPALIDSDISPQAFRKNWAPLIQKIYDESSSSSADDYLIDSDFPIETYL